MGYQKVDAATGPGQKDQPTSKDKSAPASSEADADAVLLKKKKEAEKEANYWQNLQDRLFKKKWPNDGGLTWAERNMMKSLSFAKTNQGDIGVYDGGRQIATIDRDGVDVDNTFQHHQPASQQNIETVLKGALAYKASIGNEVGIYAQTETERLMMAKAASLVGLKLKNPDLAKMSPRELDEALDKLSPGLGKKMEDEWAREQGANKPTALGYSASAATDTKSLARAPSALDKIKPGELSQKQFNPVVAPGTGTPAIVPTPAPATVPAVTAKTPGGP